MGDSKETDPKVLLKNKRVIKGTALYRYANRYAAYFALSLGCAHVGITAIMYFTDVDEYWIIGGQEQIARKAVQYGLYDGNRNTPSETVEIVAEDLKSTAAYSFYQNITEFYKIILGKYFSGTPKDSAIENSGASKGTSELSTSPIDTKRD